VNDMGEEPAACCIPYVTLMISLMHLRLCIDHPHAHYNRTRSLYAWSKTSKRSSASGVFQHLSADVGVD
jgi:hypothetical protein